MKSFTLNEPVNIEGIGLHTGVKSNVILNPAALKSGIIFNRIDKSTIIPAKWDNVISTKFSTNIASNGVEVKTVEHLLSALAGLHINNCEILIDNVEVPILDGSSNEFVESILNKGIKEQDSEQKILEIVKPVKFSCDYGITGLLTASKNKKTLSIDNFLLSCRILGRKIEDQIINKIIDIGRKNKFEFIEGIYVKTKKNSQCENFYINKNFKKINKKKYIFNLKK